VLINVEHPDYSEQSITANLPASGPKQLDFKLNKNTTLLTGQVRLDGKPMADATLVVYSNEDMGKWVGSAVTDEHGHYSIEGVPEGGRLLIAEGLWGSDAKGLRRRQMIMVKGRSTTVDIDFHALVRVSGRIGINSGEADPSTRRTLFFRSLFSYGDVRHIVPGADGEYEVFLEPGPYTVALSDGPGAPLEVPAGVAELVANYEMDQLTRESGLLSQPLPQQQLE
jgi:hypothetical protein